MTYSDTEPDKSTRVAAVLSFFLPGAGLCYLGQWSWGFVNLLSAIALGFGLPHVLTAQQLADRRPSLPASIALVSAAIAHFAAKNHNKRCAKNSGRQSPLIARGALILMILIAASVVAYDGYQVDRVGREFAKTLPRATTKGALPTEDIPQVFVITDGSSRASRYALAELKPSASPGNSAPTTAIIVNAAEPSCKVLGASVGAAHLQLFPQGAEQSAELVSLPITKEQALRIRTQGSILIRFNDGKTTEVKLGHGTINP